MHWRRSIRTASVGFGSGLALYIALYFAISLVFGYRWLPWPDIVAALVVIGAFVLSTTALAKVIACKLLPFVGVALVAHLLSPLVVGWLFVLFRTDWTTDQQFGLALTWAITLTILTVPLRRRDVSAQSRFAVLVIAVLLSFLVSVHLPPSMYVAYPGTIWAPLLAWTLIPGVFIFAQEPRQSEAKRLGNTQT